MPWNFHNIPTTMSRMPFCIICSRSILWLFIWLCFAPLLLYVVTLHWVFFALYLPITYEVLCRQTIFSHTQAAADVIRRKSNLSGVLQKWKEITSQQYLQMHSSQTPRHSNTSRWWLCDLCVVCLKLLSNGPDEFTPFYASVMCLESKTNVLEGWQLVVWINFCSLCL